MKKQVFIITIMVVAALATACGQRASGRKNTMSTSKQKAVASPTKKEQERASAVAKESLDEEDIHAALKVAKEYYKHTTQKVKSWNTMVDQVTKYSSKARIRRAESIVSFV